MKCRIGFVSNSSSSSFIIAGKNLDKALFWKHTLDEIFGDKKNCFDVLTTKEDVDDYYSGTDNVDEYKQALSCIEKGKTIICGYCSDQDYVNPIAPGLIGGGWEDVKLPPEFEYEVIVDCEGY